MFNLYTLGEIMLYPCLLLKRCFYVKHILVQVRDTPVFTFTLCFLCLCVAQYHMVAERGFAYTNK